MVRAVFLLGLIASAAAASAVTPTSSKTHTSHTPTPIPTLTVSLLTCNVNGTNQSPQGAVANGTAVGCATGFSPSVLHVTCKNGALNDTFTCVSNAAPTTAAALRAAVRAFETAEAFNAWLAVATGLNGFSRASTDCGVQCDYSNSTNAFIATTQCFACSGARQLQVGNSGFVCLPGVSAVACARAAVCFGILDAGASCLSVSSTLPFCPACNATLTPTDSSSSKKGLLGLLGLLGLIPLLCCSLLCLLCLCRRKKADPEVHFATFDPSCGPPVGTLPTHSIPCNVGTSFVPAQQWGTIA